MKLEPRCVIQQNARRLVALHDRVQDTFSHKNTGPEARADWSRACDAYRDEYDVLAFPGGYASGLRKIAAGDAHAIEIAIAFVEVRPYFPRSQYIRTKLVRLLKRAPLTARQRERVQSALSRHKTSLLKTQTARRVS